MEKNNYFVDGVASILAGDCETAVDSIEWLEELTSIIGSYTFDGSEGHNIVVKTTKLMTKACSDASSAQKLAVLVNSEITDSTSDALLGFGVMWSTLTTAKNIWKDVKDTKVFPHLQIYITKLLELDFESPILIFLNKVTSFKVNCAGVSYRS